MENISKPFTKNITEKDGAYTKNRAQEYFYDKDE